MNRRRYHGAAILNYIDIYEDDSEDDEDDEYDYDELCEEDMEEQSELSCDKWNIVILLFLYALQGIPIGVTMAISIMLQKRGASYKDQASFSLTFCPFCLKLFWAPIVDSLYVRCFGRRKFWLVPVQLLLAGMLLLLGTHMDEWLTDRNVAQITMMLFLLNFLAATQDIAIDGWSLTMLKRCNIGYASICNRVGQAIGRMLSFTVFLQLESSQFCNKFIRDVPKDMGLVTLPEFLWFWGITFIAATVLVALLKREQDECEETDTKINLSSSYSVLFSIISKRPVQILAGILLTAKMPFAAHDAAASLKLIEAGVSKERLAVLDLAKILVELVTPLVLRRYTNGPRPMDLYLKAILSRIILTLLITLIISGMTLTISGGEVPLLYFTLFTVCRMLYFVCRDCMTVTSVAFFAQISDPNVGGTYMTLLSTLSNLGGFWANYVALCLIDVLTEKECSTDPENLCLNEEQQRHCSGSCDVVFDGYYLEAMIFIVIGFLWLFIAGKWIRYLQDLPTREWLVNFSKSQIKYR